jgi:eukaryotic-like serine/threonine-protein kinase
MFNESLVEQLVQEALDNNLTAEEACAEHPELVGEVREQWQRCRKLDAELEAIFPSSHTSGEGKSRAPLQLSAKLPHISGYEVESILGRGGMGVVYKAKQLKLNRPVALKMLLAGNFATKPEIARFTREAEAIAALRHSNVVQIYDIGDFEGCPYFTMEFMEGGTLAARVAGTPQPAAGTAALITTLAGAVQVAHNAGIVHRDLKPSNIFLTTDGIPKIGDFGLARNFEADENLTFTGTRVGTPSYMAPEQALGKVSAVGPASDTYSLGAILYEMLTGRPPFRGETASDTERQVILEQPVPPSRLNGKVPRDLETICLKCLSKEPTRRYATAAALADDLRRFQNGDPIAARRPGSLERWSKWVRRRPALATMVASAVLLAIVSTTSALMLAFEQAQRRHALEGDLREVSALQERARWTEAIAALQRAESRLGGLGSQNLRTRAEHARRDLDLVIELDRIRLSRATSGTLAFYKTKADRDYAKVFADSGLAAVHDPPESVARVISASAVRYALVAALDDWAVCAADTATRDWALEVARKADPDLHGWRDRIRDPGSWQDGAAISEMAAKVPMQAAPVSLLLALAERTGNLKEETLSLLRRVQKEHPADFWANLILGNALLIPSPDEALGYYRATLASRPQAAVAYSAVGDALRGKKSLDEAIEYYHLAIQLNPGYARAHTNLGNALNDTGRSDEAIACYQTALRADPNYAWAHFDFANVLKGQGRLEDATYHYEQVVALDPKDGWGHYNLAQILKAQGRLQEAADHYEEFGALEPKQKPLVERRMRSISSGLRPGEELRLELKQKLDANPAKIDNWLGYAELCLYLDNEEEYRRVRRDLLARFGASDDSSTAERTARTYLLGSVSDDELGELAVLVDRATAGVKSENDTVVPYLQFTRGLLCYRQGRFDGAIEVMKGEVSQKLIVAAKLVLAMALYRSGQTAEAQQALAAGIDEFDWSPARADNRFAWTCHILRREAETIVLATSPEF